MIIISVILIIMLPNKFKNSDSWGTYHFAVLAHDVIKDKIVGLVHGTLVQRENPDFDETEKLFACVPKEERDSIWNYNDFYSEMFYHNGVISQNPFPLGIVISPQAYSHLFPAEKMKMLGISNYEPRWVFISPCQTYFFPTDSAYLSDNYEVYYQTDTTKCNYQLLRRKD